MTSKKSAQDYLDEIAAADRREYIPHPGSRIATIVAAACGDAGSAKEVARMRAAENASIQDHGTLSELKASKVKH